MENVTITRYVAEETAEAERRGLQGAVPDYRACLRSLTAYSADTPLLQTLCRRWAEGYEAFLRSGYKAKPLSEHTVGKHLRTLRHLQRTAIAKGLLPPHPRVNGHERLVHAPSATARMRKMPMNHVLAGALLPSAEVNGERATLWGADILLPDKAAALAEGCATLPCDDAALSLWISAALETGMPAEQADAILDRHYYGEGCADAALVAEAVERISDAAMRGHHAESRYWYAVRTFGVNASTLAPGLAAQCRLSTSHDVYLPQMPDGKCSVTSRLMFVRTTRTGISEVASWLKDRGMVYRDRGAKHYTPVPQRQIRHLQIILGQTGAPVEEMDPGLLTIGREVTVRTGPYAGMAGRLVRIKRDRRVIVGIEGVCAYALLDIRPENLTLH